MRSCCIPVDAVPCISFVWEGWLLKGTHKRVSGISAVADACFEVVLVFRVLVLFGEAADLIASGHVFS